MFDTLYDEDIISEDAFLQWEKSNEEPGKGVAMKQVVQFFTWLRDTEDDNGHVIASMNSVLPKGINNKCSLSRFGNFISIEHKGILL